MIMTRKYSIWNSVFACVVVIDTFSSFNSDWAFARFVVKLFVALRALHSSFFVPRCTRKYGPFGTCVSWGGFCAFKAFTGIAWEHCVLCMDRMRHSGYSLFIFLALGVGFFVRWCHVRPDFEPDVPCFWVQLCVHWAIAPLLPFAFVDYYRCPTMLYNYDSTSSKR